MIETIRLMLSYGPGDPKMIVLSLKARTLLFRDIACRDAMQYRDNGPPTIFGIPWKVDPDIGINDIMVKIEV